MGRQESQFYLEKVTSQRNSCCLTQRRPPLLRAARKFFPPTSVTTCDARRYRDRRNSCSAASAYDASTETYRGAPVKRLLQPFGRRQLGDASARQTSPACRPWSVPKRRKAAHARLERATAAERVGLVGHPSAGHRLAMEAVAWLLCTSPTGALIGISWKFGPPSRVS